MITEGLLNHATPGQRFGRCSRQRNLLENGNGTGHATTHEWLSLRELTDYADISARTLRSWIYSRSDPLPAVKVSGKVLVRKSDFDRYLDRHRIRPLRDIDLDGIVQEVLKGGPRGR